MRPRATRQTDWTQLGMGACALVLPPLALGAALYSMLEPADGDVMRSGGADAVLPDHAQPAQTGLPMTAAGGPAGGGQQIRDTSASVQGRAPAQVLTRNVSVPAAPANAPVYASIEGASSQSPPPAAAASRRSIRNAKRQPQRDVITTWLQQIGLLSPQR
jgi:hypothetical protein